MSLTIHSYRLCFLVMRTFKIHSLSNFQICNTLLLMIVTMLYITPPWCIYYWKFIPFDSLPAPGNHQCIHCTCVLDETYVIMSNPTDHESQTSYCAPLRLKSSWRTQSSLVASQVDSGSPGSVHWEMNSFSFQGEESPTALESHFFFFLSSPFRSLAETWFNRSGLPGLRKQTDSGPWAPQLPFLKGPLPWQESILVMPVQIFPSLCPCRYMELDGAGLCSTRRLVQWIYLNIFCVLWFLTS